ncbi:serine carboxypeptidase-like 13 isoform X1 [Carya illinoinensis]|uniref:Serine carboxypeptidase-like 18 n=1 Tax=Carya illinoinensis TaxID=32201 RepID=A0A8T1QDG9_CARIL|nr:serine carboxypeptidase-like 13 isoform X1 [Carya illinoinensis]XP_042980505.1 serine carboxypeptidase-like 13 isoform X1 [Carya illinoinensis]XP_042980506.1 serine carboxypeptidase-like 13 isoform X1 [Carya illinoinensis]XP_042980507.1 serine carboxypeptidase-like 13 isoform X1 [Carya illinoinensis]XP_042980508.1 serine carboxypeptidase-like 13 isoform X1 [Carya illinoinensis]XP_042980510.1 serine carboxypeptidase-like 13 isoform X1 [Carya illinoinensis]XP_042980511.1 serine carboxypeptid
MSTLSMASITLVFVLVFLIVLMCMADSHSIVETLPGFPGKLPFKLETGYVGVGEADEVQLFYYFVESERNPKMDPLLLWLTGGPGCSSFTGFVYENIGPLKFNYEDFDGNLPTFLLNPYSWTQVASIIFLDAPVGSGFSYARTSQGYNITDKISAAQTYQFLRKWLITHPQFQSNVLYVGGDSYSGIVVPIIVEEIYNGNKVGKEPYLKLNGYLLGNPVTDRRGDVNAEIEYAYRVSLISNELYASLKESCQGEYVVVDPANVQCVKDLAAFEDCIANIDVAHILEPNCHLISPKSNGIELPHQAIMDENQRNVLQLLSWSKSPPALWCRSYTYVLSYIWANDENVQNALHIRKGTIKNWVRCNKTMSAYTYNVISTVDYHRNFTEQTGYRSLIYNGDQDMSVSYVGTLQWIRTLNMTLESSWEPWFVEGQVAGYTMRFTKNKYRMTYATIKGGGHTAPEYKPKESFAMAYRWLAHYYL